MLKNPMLQHLTMRRNANIGITTTQVANLYKEKAMLTALIAAHQTTITQAGHIRKDSVANAARKLEEYEHLLEGRDIALEREIEESVRQEVNFINFSKSKAAGRRTSMAAIRFLPGNVLDDFL
ncbi:hypothetical protein HK100_002849 [Physocladia obscura]|uniref:Uncharacterized protein n=1 Tax=Physocladia obscura TaxID=109957 RepID=A0AAD5SWD7_9FUNG|nr:hypothetical protein HK100_002849 [Physocladia obscura]